MNPQHQPQQQPRPAYHVTSAMNPRPPLQNGPLPPLLQQGPAQKRPSIPQANSGPARPQLAQGSAPVPPTLGFPPQPSQNGIPPQYQRSQPESSTGGPSNLKVTQPKPSGGKYSKPLEVRTDPRAVVSKLLYVHGDVETPNTEAVDFVLDMAYDFMVQLMNPGPAPKPSPPHFNSTSQAQTITTSTLRHRLRGPHNRKKLAVLQEAIIKQKLAADKAKKAAVVEKKTKRKVGGEQGEAEVDVEDLAANLDMPGMSGFGGIY
ncbi:hypothetical protein FFLO_00434 [Filobasidium floriforme]|uniref:Uncharacterized protein n=1 Tax=Filobasidium floriforme TaxID=5210 RepID=A0A8K0NTJ7_9TREE|nr:uncharacterized protein HD553DRAFT_318985 [Filobasidium floriforme]KAG7575270.1 hypothetical protein FFLO_00434 [Filobasidium floriforme]KAH8078942.1 hypothetical protein HD553DRAFT_318985 [Filobasidium floriforme]